MLQFGKQVKNGGIVKPFYYVRSKLYSLLKFLKSFDVNIDKINIKNIEQKIYFSFYKVFFATLYWNILS